MLKLRLSFGLLLVLFSSFSLEAKEGSQKMHGIAMHGEPKYPADFKHFQGVNPEAPKGGAIKLAVVGSFDSTNPYINKGIPPAGLSLYSEKLIFEPLMRRSPDEPLSQYGLIAESVEVAPNRSWIVFHLRPEAKWSDGQSITADDVIFSHQIVRDKGRFNLRSLYERVAKVEKLGERSVKFSFKPEKDGSFDPELVIVMGMMNVLPKHILEKQDFEKGFFNPLVGSGPYKIKEMSLGKYIVYERRSNYWGKDLPVNKGYFNFDTIRYDYYLDSKVAFEAFKAGHYDYRVEPDYALWIKGYHFSAVKQGKVVKLEIPHNQPVGMKALVFNTRKDFFSDVKIRQALLYAFDFDWINKNLLHGAYVRTRSFFDNTELASKNLPEGKELEILSPFKDQLPKEVFNAEYNPPSSNGSGHNRENLKRALALLKEAGWVIKNNKLTHEKTGKTFEFEILLYNKDDERLVIPFIKALKQWLGIHARLRTVDTAQFENRRLKYDYDMITQHWGHSLSPGNEQLLYWSSDVADTEGSRNYAAVKNKAIDQICKKLATAKTREGLVASCKALDRALLWGHYIIPLAHQNKYYIAYWDKIDHPEIRVEAPILSIATWWSKEKDL
jgi:microcin C transport system substrate-binding protein